MTSAKIDLGLGFAYSFFCWSPDRKLNPQFAKTPDIDPAGILIWRGDVAVSVCWFDTPLTLAVRGEGTPAWRVECLVPLHIEPSVQMYFWEDGKLKPSYHGWIRGGKWVSA